MEKPKILPNTTNIVMVMPNGGASDKALKKNITEVTAARERIGQLRSVTWEWKNKKEGLGVQHGFVAQEIESVFPELVEERIWEDGTPRKFVYVNALIPHIIKALQEQQEQIDLLQDKIRKLQDK